MKKTISLIRNYQHATIASKMVSLILFLMITPISNTYGQQCVSSTVLYETCNTSFMMSSPSSSGYTYLWYECDASGNNGSYISGGSTGSLTVYPTQTTTNETHYYYYWAQDQVSPYPMVCQSGLITLKYDFDVIIADVSGTYTVQPYTSLSYTYQWYADYGAGPVQIPGQTGTSYTPTRSGAHTVIRSSSTCSSGTSNGITYFAPNSQCNSTPTTLATCSTAYTLSYTPASGYDVIWYECDAYGGSASVLNGGSPTNNFTVYPVNTYHNHTYYYFYVCTDGFVPCSSAVITLKYDYELDFSISGSVPSAVLTIQPYSSYNTYSNYQWFRNGHLISGATSSTYTATLPGNYYLIADANNCGQRTSLTNNVGCGTNTYSANYTFPTGTTNITSGTIEFEGTITIPEGAVVNISNATIHMKQDAQIVVDKAVTNNGGILNIDNTIISSCGTWYGIVVAGVDSNYAGLSKSATLSLTTVQISDAKIGVYAFDNAYIDIDVGTFTNNYVHIHIERFAGSGAGNTYIQHSAFSNLMLVSPTLSGSAVYPVTSFQYPSFRPFVYLYQANKFYFTSNSYVCFNPPSRNQVAIVNYAPTTTNTNSMYLDGENLSGDFHTGILAENIKSLNVSNSTSIIGDIDNGIITENVYSVGIYNADIRNNVTQGVTGIRTRNTINAYHIQYSFIKNFVNGIECYNETDMAGDITQNSIISNTYGIVMAPICHPVTGSCGNNSSYYGSNTNMRFIYMNCNKILGNDWGIIGVGELEDQGDQNGYEWGTFFDYTVGNTTSTYADIAWYNSANPITFVVYDSTGNNNQYGAYYFQWPSTSTTIELDGNTVAYNANDAARDVSPNKACRGQFKTNSFNSINSNIVNSPARVEVYPIPFNSILSIKHTNIKFINISIVDMTGKIIMNTQNKNSDITLLNTENIPTGFYFIRIQDCNSGELISKQKLVKMTD